MPKLEAYSHQLDYSYAPGIFPSHALLNARPELARRLLVRSDAAESEGVRALMEKCAALNVRTETADRALERISRKENCYAALVFDKFSCELSQTGNHIVLVNPSDMGNLGTILRACLGFSLPDLAIIRPAADVFDPRVVRASMGALFSMRVGLFDSFEAYRAAYPEHALYPFMLDGSMLLEDAVRQRKALYALVFGNEGSGLPPEFSKLGQAVRIPHSGEIDSLNLSIAVGIGAYAFVHAPEKGE